MRGKVVLTQLDDALIRLRRLWHTHPRSGPLEPGASAPELSTVLVADAIHRQHQEQGAPVRVADVAHRLAVAPSTASRLVDRAVRAAVVARGTDPEDPRRAVLTLTPAGTALLATAFAFRTRYLERVLAGWNATDVETLARLLDRFATAVHTHGLPVDRTP